MNADGFEWDGQDRRASDAVDRRWHVGKEIPLALIVALFLQTAGGIWWAAGLTAKVDRALEALAEFRQERYTKDDARRDRELLMQIVDGLRQHDNEHDRRLGAIEDRLERGGRK